MRNDVVRVYEFRFHELIESEKKYEKLKQAFEKMRAEILEKYWDCDICKYNGHFNIRGDISDILQIIDKYRNEVM